MTTSSWSDFDKEGKTYHPGPYGKNQSEAGGLSLTEAIAFIPFAPLMWAARLGAGMFGGVADLASGGSGTNVRRR